MEMVVNETDTGVTHVTLKGSLDIAGAGDIDLKMSVIGGNSDKVLVDMAEVPFMASVGIRTLVKAAKAIANRGGKMVIARPTDPVEKVFRTTGVDAMIPIHDEIDNAMSALVAA